MTVAGLIHDRPAQHGLGPVVTGSLGLAGAVAVRVAVAGGRGASSVAAGLVFALALMIVAGSLGYRPGRPQARSVLPGLLGGAVLCAGPLLARGGVVGPAELSGLPVWATGVAAVAVAEEVLLRGALFDAVTRWQGRHAAVLVTSVAFGLLHAPVYGWAVVPLDIAVGLGLGALRLWTGGLTAPIVAHLGADLAGWWLR